ncbi:MAG: ferritin family protein [Magnetococcales bacterium]|nr:ferritin family protein [Magnetococcales bacterium]
MDNLDKLLDESLDLESCEELACSDTFDEIIRFAIDQEELEHTFYLKLAKRVDSKDGRDLMERHAAEEKQQIKLLSKVLSDHHLPEENPGGRTIPNADLRIADFLTTLPSGDGNLTYQDALILSIKMEQSRVNLYEDLANLPMGAVGYKTFTWLAREELKQKNILEREYDDIVLDAD